MLMHMCFHLLIRLICLELHHSFVAARLEQVINRRIISGVSFNITILGNLSVESNLPSCIRFQKCISHIWGSCTNHISGLCFPCDFSKEITRKTHLEHQVEATQSTLLQFTRIEPHVGNVTIYLSLQLYDLRSIRDFSLCNEHDIADDATSFLEVFKCHTRSPTVALIYITKNLCYESLNVRTHLLNLFNSYFVWHNQSTYPTHNNANQRKYTESSRVELKFIHPSEILRDLQSLATAQANGFTMMQEGSFAALWHVGCGSIAPDALELLSRLEHDLQNGPLPIRHLQVLGDQGGNDMTNLTSSYHITKWTVGDLPFVTGCPTATTSGNFESISTVKRVIKSAPLTPNTLEEGSGMLPSYYSTGAPAADNYDKFYGGPTRSSFLQPIPPVKITVHQITNVQIPPKTLYSTAVLKNLKLMLYVTSPSGGNLTAKQIRDPATDSHLFGTPVTRDSKEWISFDTSNRIIRLRPEPKHVGDHRLILCATTDNYPRACEPFLLTVGRPSPFRKNFILRIPPGIHWCYRVPIYWFEELKVTSFHSLELNVNGDSPFSWDAQTSEVCVITMLKTEKTITLFFYASNKEIAQSVEIEFRLSAKVPPPQRLITESTLRLQLQWPDQLKNYQLQELNRINASLAHALRVRVNPEVTASSLFVYDLLQFFTSTNISSPAILEMEWIFLPYGLPTDHDKDWAATSIALNTTDNRHLGGGTHASYVERSSLTLTLSELLMRCKKTSLDGADIALKAAEESFRPFTLQLVQLKELDYSACQTAKRFTDKSQQVASGSGLPLTDNTGKMQFQEVTFRILPDVITNFTVFAGVSFKKLINVAKAAPLRRIQFLELIDIHGLKLDDSAWLGLTSDKTHLFGLPLQHHTRKQPYLFTIQIHTVDQKTPIAVGFTVEVQNWFEAFLQPQQQRITPNHRVRLQIIPNVSNRNWVIEPINSLDYRWHLSTAIDRFLQPTCPPPCNPDVGIWELTKHSGTVIFVIWAQLSLLLETTNTSSLSQNTVATCPWEKINRLQSLLLFAPSTVSVEKHVGSFTEYPTDGQFFHSPWSAPSTSFRLHVTTMGLGTVEAALVDRMGVCARGPTEQGSLVEASQSIFDTQRNFSTSDEPQFTIYTGEGFRYNIPQAQKLRGKEDRELYLFDGMGQRIGSSNWIGLETDKSTIFGILMGNTVQPITYRFRIAPYAQLSQEHVSFSVHVAGSNPQLPRVYNHRVIMRFGAESGKPWAGGHSLSDRWRLVASLDTFLRPHCTGNPVCANNMDVLLLTFNYQAHGFTVIWAQKSLLMKSQEGGEVNDQIASIEQQQHWDKWMKQSQHWSVMSKTNRKKRRLENAIVTKDQYGDHRRVIKLQRSSGEPQFCPERDLIHLERRLLGDTGFGLQPLPELAAHMQASGVGILREVQMERLGPCSKLESKIPFLIPEPVIGTGGYQMPHGNPYKPVDYNSKISTSYGPLGEENRQRNLLLGILLPICGAVILLLLGVLAFVWYRKREQSSNKENGTHLKVIHDGANPETGRMFKVGHENHFKNNDALVHEQDVRKSRTGCAKAVERQKPLAHNVPDSTEEESTPPTKPLILPNERPPLKPPEYNLAYTDSPMNSLPTIPTGATAMATGLNTTQNRTGSECIESKIPPKAFYGMRPNPYRNLPPPIDVKPGMPMPGSQVPYAPYRRTNSQIARTPDLAHMPER